MDELIQILVFVVSFVVFIVSALRKQKRKVVHEANDINHDLLDFFNVNETNEEKEGELKINSVNEKIVEQSKKNKKSHDKEVIINEKTNQTNEYIDDNTDNDIEFDLRSAVIYSEILKRKTF